MMLLDIATSKKTISNCTDRLVPGRTRTCLRNRERQGVPGLTCANQLDRWRRDGMGGPHPGACANQVGGHGWGSLWASL